MESQKLKLESYETTAEVGSIMTYESRDLSKSSNSSTSSKSTLKSKVKHFFSISPEVRAEMERERMMPRGYKGRRSPYEGAVMSKATVNRMSVL
jgi:hypothetical protein